MFQCPVQRIKTTTLKASSTRKLCASEEVAGRTERGRHAITITNTGTDDVAVGDATVTKTTGMPIKAGERLTIPLLQGRDVEIYVVGGTVVLTEYF